MTRFREVCKMTHVPLQWVGEIIKTERCLIEECKTCNRTYAGKGWHGLFHGQDMWENKYSLCNNATTDELLDYGKYETLTDAILSADEFPPFSIVVGLVNAKRRKKEVK
jgi:hypothetical protein